MPFIPHTQHDIDEMLAEIGIDQLDALFDEIPAGLISDRLDNVPDGMGEMAMLQYMAQRAEQDQGYSCFLGGGSYDHHIPSAVWDLTARGDICTLLSPLTRRFEHSETHRVHHCDDQGSLSVGPVGNGVYGFQATEKVWLLNDHGARRCIVQQTIQSGRINQTIL